jgi:hypothetical protein
LKLKDRGETTGLIEFKSSPDSLGGFSAFTYACKICPALWPLLVFCALPGFSMIGRFFFDSLSPHVVKALEVRPFSLDGHARPLSDSAAIVRVIAAISCIIIAVSSIGSWRNQAWLRWRQDDYFNRITTATSQAQREAAMLDTLPKIDERRLLAQEHLADMYWISGKLVEAENIYYELWLTRMNMSAGKSYDPRFVTIMLKSAALHRDMDKIDDAIKNYQSISYYDSSLMPDDQKLRARDLDNFGVAYYLAGLSKPTRTDGMPFYEKAIENFKQALDAYSAASGATSIDTANVLYNESVVWREMGRNREADLARTQAELIRSQSGRLWTMP